MATQNGGRVTILIRVQADNDYDDADSPRKKGIRRGSFQGPDPLVSVTPGTELEWEISPSSYDFTLTFHNVSPFPGVTTISKDKGGNGKSVALPATILGHFHYSVTVTDGATTWVITSCPELDVGTTS